jgi:hypothetical protein
MSSSPLPRPNPTDSPIHPLAGANCLNSQRRPVFASVLGLSASFKFQILVLAANPWCTAPPAVSKEVFNDSRDGNADSGQILHNWPPDGIDDVLAEATVSSFAGLRPCNKTLWPNETCIPAVSKSMPSADPATRLMGC